MPVWPIKPINLSFCVFQFAQFALMTQLVAATGCYVLKYINQSKMKHILVGHAVSNFLPKLMMLYRLCYARSKSSTIIARLFWFTCAEIDPDHCS